MMPLLSEMPGILCDVLIVALVRSEFQLNMPFPALKWIANVIRDLTYSFFIYRRCKFNQLCNPFVENLSIMPP